MRRRTDAPLRPVTGVLTTSGRQHWRHRSRRHLTRPSSSGAAVTGLVLLMVVAAIVALALAASGGVRLPF